MRAAACVGDKFWPYKRWAVKAMVAQGRHTEAIAFAESCRNPWASDGDIDALCEDILLSLSRVDEAYSRYALSANRTGTYLTWFRAVAKKYPNKPRAVVLSDLVRFTPGDEGKWFAAAKDAKLFDEAVALANRTPCDPKTLTRAARDFAEKNPAFAVGAGLAALRWLVNGYGYEITSSDVRAAYLHTLTAATNAGGSSRGPDPHPSTLRQSGRSQRIRCQHHRERRGPGLTPGPPDSDDRQSGSDHAAA